MPESTLSVTYPQLQAETGIYLGYGGDTTVWTTASAAEVDRYIQAGYRQFLYPPGIPDPTTGQPQARHTWSFLKPTSPLTTTASADQQDLPDDFGGMDGDFTFVSTGTIYGRIAITSESRIRDLRQGTTAAGVPALAAIRPKRSDQSHGQRYEVMFYPTPDAAYSLEYSYNALQAALTTLRPYPLGGMAHSETLIESVLAKAEQRGNDTPQGPHWQAFMEALGASVAHDRSIRQPEVLGYCSDHSDARELNSPFERLRFTTVQYVPVP